MKEFCLLLLLFVVAACTDHLFILVKGDVIISPQNPVARVNEGFALTCRAADAEKNLIESCSWLRNNQSLPFLNAGYSDFGYITTNECVIYVRNITQDDTGLWTCNIWGPNGKESASTVLTVIDKPKVSLSPHKNPTRAIAGTEVEFNCSVTDTQLITPEIEWTIGNSTMNSSHHRTHVNGNTFTESIRYVFQANDHNQTLSCRIGGKWIDPSSQHGAKRTNESSARLFVLSPPHPLDPITFHLKIGRPGVIAVNFSVTPRPRIVYWQLSNGTKLYVEPYIEPVSNYTPYQIFQLKTLNHTTYEAKLLIKTVTADQNSLTLVVESNLEDVVEYLLLFNTSRLPRWTWIVFIGAAVIVVVLGGICYWRRRRRSADDSIEAPSIEEKKPEKLTEMEREMELRVSNESLNLQLAHEQPSTAEDEGAVGATESQLSTCPIEEMKPEAAKLYPAVVHTDV